MPRALLASLFVVLVSFRADAQAPAPNPRAIPVKVTPVTARPLVEDVRFIATVEPSVSTTVGAEVAGRVMEVPMREGERVAAGTTVLARLDPGPREISLREAQAAVTKAREEFEKLRRGYREEEVAQRVAETAEHKAVLDRARADALRAEALHREEIISLAELQRFQAEHEAARQKHQRALEALRMARAGPRAEEIAQAEADLAGAQARADRIADEIRRSTIAAPISGYVVKKLVEVGAWVQPGTAVASLIALDPVEVSGPVGEREIRRIRPGQSAQVMVDAYPGRAFTGTVIAVVPSADAASRTFPVKVTVANPDGLLKAGMFARVAVVTGRRRTALFVPKDALVRRGGQEIVFVVHEDEATAVRVETGVEVDGFVEVRADSLAAGQQAVTLGNEFLQPGTKVRPTR
jgi:HlyD family secretion protein